MAEQSIYKHIYKIDLNDHLKRRDVGILATHDSNANRFGAELTQGGKAFDVSSYSVFGYFIRPNMETVLIEGTAEGNTVYVDLSANCYVYDGAFTLSVKIVNGDMTQTILVCDGHLAEARTGVIIDPEHVVPSLEEVLAKMAEVDEATNNANNAAAEALRIANEAANTANEAAGNANKAAEDIDSKVAEANAELSGKVGQLSEEADELKQTYEADTAPPIVQTAQGDGVITVADSAHRPFKGLKLYGKTTQDGTPTPESPVPLVSVGDGGSIAVFIENGGSVTVQTPNGLPGIPVESGGNYTDSNGQMWACDEVDCGRGVYVKRVNDYTFTGSEDFKVSPTQQGDSDIRYDANIASLPAAKVAKVLNSHYPFVAANRKGTWALDDGVYSHLRIRIQWEYATEKELKNFLAERYADNDPVTMQYALYTPIETPLSAEELAQYAAMMTQYPNTTVINDADCGMGLDYVTDTKLYVDNKLAEIAAAIVNQ